LRSISAYLTVALLWPSLTWNSECVH
jgi:hypothetical protein